PPAAALRSASRSISPTCSISRDSSPSAFETHAPESIASLQRPAAQRRERALHGRQLLRLGRLPLQVLVASNGDLQRLAIALRGGETRGVVGEARAREVVVGESLGDLS